MKVESRNHRAGVSSTAFFIAALLTPPLLRADVVTPKKGPPFRGTVVSIDEKSVTVKSETETRVIDRASIRKIEFGEALLTGTQGREYTNAEYALRASIPPGWSTVRDAGADLAARKGSCTVFLKGLPGTEGYADEVMKGAINGMKTSVPGSEFGPLEDSVFSGIEFRKASLKSSRGDGAVFFHARRGYLVMLLILSEDKQKPAEPCLADWDKQIRLADD